MALRASAFGLAVLLAGATVGAQPLAGGDIAALRAGVAAERIARAREQEREGRPLEAEASYREAATADPSRIEGFLGCARLLRQRGRTEEAAATLRAVPPRALVDDAAVTALAEAWTSMGRADEALTLLRDRAHGAEGWRALAALATRQGAFAEALAASRRVLAAGDASRAAGLSVRALTQLNAELDVVRRPPAGTASTLRRWLADERTEPRGW